MKQETGFSLWRSFGEELRKHYYCDKEHTFWSYGYFVCSIGEGASYETIHQYSRVAAIPALLSAFLAGGNMKKYQKILIGLLIVLSLGIYGDKSFKDNRFKEIEEVKAQTIQDIEDYQKKDRVIPLTKKQEKELAKAKKEKEIALEKEKVKKVNDDFGKSLDNIEGKINNLDFNYENPYDKLSKEDQDRLSKENKDRLNKLTEKAKKDQEGLAKLRKEPSQKDNTDYQNAALNKIRDNNNKKVETKIRQEEEKRKKEEQKKKEQAAKQKATTSG